MFDLNIFQNESLRIENFSVTYAQVKPTDEFVCRKGNKRYDRFFYISEGTIHFKLEDGEELTASTGDIVYLPNNCCYSCYWDSKPEGKHFSVTFVLFNAKNDVCTVGDKIQIIFTDRHRKYYSLLKEMTAVWLKGEIGYAFKCNMLFWDFLHNLFVDTTVKSLKYQYHGIYKGLVFLENNYTTDVTPKYLAELCGMSLTSFRRLFKEITGTSPVKYKNMLRMKKALSLLKTGEYSVTEAGASVGCPDIAYFNKLFKNAFNKNPSEFMVEPEKEN